MKKILFIVLILVLLAGCRSEPEVVWSPNAEVEPSEAVAKAIESSTVEDCNNLPLEAQQQACRETLQG